MPLSTRSGKTYDSNASSITSSRRAKSTKPARSSKRATSRSGEGKETIPVKSTSSTKGNSTTNSVSRENPSTGKENSDYQESHPDVRTSSGTIAVHDIAPPLGQKAVLIPSQPSSLVPNYPVLQEMTTAPYEPPTPSQPSEAMEIDQAEIQDPTAGEDRSMDIEPIQLNSYESQAITIYQSQHRLYQTAKGIGHMADMKRTLTECQRSYRDISKRLTWQFALNILDGWNPFQEAKHVKVLKTNQSRASPVASTSRLPTSSNSSSNPGSNGNTKGKGKKPEPNNLNQLGKIPKKDISWRETMAAARALQRAQAQMLEDLRKEEDEKSSKRRRKD
ncbi:hypothetical protein Pst134EB_020250 [Puccinia striiformis f. sp. tritici]|nr:hypothetical protein Pst134EB_020250 [Puccinia striiformis f. sp. tritici]